eukprot:gene13119-15491_t
MSFASEGTILSHLPIPSHRLTFHPARHAHRDANPEPTGRHSSARAKGGRGRSKERRAEPEPEGGEETGAFGFASAFQTLVQEAEEIPTEAPRQTDEHPLDTEQNTANNGSKQLGGPKLLTHLKEENHDLRELLIQSGLFQRVCTGLKKMGLEAPTDMKEASLRECAGGQEDAVAVRALLARRRMPTDTPRGQLVHLLAELVDRLSLEEDEQAYPSQALHPLPRELHRYDVPDVTGLAAELKGAAKKLYKGLYETRESAAEQAVSRAKEAAKLAERAGYLARRAKGEEKPLDFLARFVAFKQHISEVHQISLQYSAEHGPGKKDLDQLVKVPDYDGEEEDGWDEALCPLDMLTISSDRYIPDDEIRSILFESLPRGVFMTAVFDCCHSGTLSDQRVVKVRSGARGTEAKPAGEAPEQQGEKSVNRARFAPPPPQAVQAEKISEVWAERAARMKDQERRTEACLSFSKLQEGSSSGAAVPDVKNAVDACIHQASANKSKALLVGINYTGSDYALNGCINDVHHVKQLLTSQYGFGTSPDVLRILTDEPGSSGSPTCSNMREGLRWLVSDAVAGDQLFFHFSGHGTQAPFDDEAALQALAGVLPSGKQASAPEQAEAAAA